jgi:hypothetical protein
MNAGEHSISNNGCLILRNVQEMRLYPLYAKKSLLGVPGSFGPLTDRNSSSMDMGRISIVGLY